MTQEIRPIVRVGLELSVTHPNSNAENLKKSFSFIYGVGTAGLCGFEMALAGKTTGDSVNIDIEANEFREYFGELYFPLLKAMEQSIQPKRICFQGKIVKVNSVDNRDVVTYLAKSVGHGGSGEGCGCDCSCG